MLRKIIFLHVIALLLSVSLLGQQTEEDVIQAIKEVEQKIQANSDVSSSIQKLKKISRANTSNPQISAVAYALAGKALSQKGYHNQAYPFLKKAYFYRKKQGEFHPQKWALSSLVDNGIDRKNYKQAVKYGKHWIKLEEKYGKDTFLTPDFVLKQILKRLSPTESLFNWQRKQKETDKDFQKRRKYGHCLIKHTLKKYPKHRDKIISINGENPMAYYSYLVHFAKVEDIKMARYWEKQGLKLAQKYRTPQQYTDHIRYFITLYNGSDAPWVTPASEPSEYEKEGLRLTHRYIKACKKIKRHDQVMFGYRYLSKRHRLADNYAKAIQALAEAIKYGRKHNLPEKEIIKSFGGIQSIVNTIARKNDKKGLLSCKEWKNHFKLKGLTQEDIKSIDNVIAFLENSMK